VPVTVLGTGDKLVTKIDKDPCLLGAFTLVERDRKKKKKKERDR